MNQRQRKKLAKKRFVCARLGCIEPPAFRHCKMGSRYLDGVDELICATHAEEAKRAPWYYP